MKILLIGKNGQVGAEIERQAVAKKIEIVALGREDLDIVDSMKVEEVIAETRPSVIINASAYHVVPDCELYPDKAFLINAVALKKLADVCDKEGIQLIHYSTDYVFDGLKGEQYLETDTPHPLQVYGISKDAGEKIVLQYCKNGVVIRTCGVFGGQTGSRSKKGNFVLTILKQTEGKEEMEVSSEQIVSPSYAKDIAKATLELLKKKDMQGIYHLVNEGYCSWADFAQEIVRVHGRKTKIIPVDRGGMAGSLRRPLLSALKNNRAKELGIVLPTWEDAVKRYLESLSN
jgi:dTDP-4-dehydrorhamnose reductase